jgi:hypothetical protein
LPTVSTRQQQCSDGKFAACAIVTGGKSWKQYQTGDTLKGTWRKKFTYMLTQLTKGVPKKIIKTFLVEIFFAIHFELRISPQILKKNLKLPEWYPQGLDGNWFMKKPKVENLVALSL